jgi:hypothetical protein
MRTLKKTKPGRPVIRVDVRTGDVVRFPSIKDAQKSSRVSSISMNLLTNKPLKGYRFFYEEDWEGQVF